MNEITVDVYREGTLLTIDAKQPEEATHTIQRPTVAVSQVGMFGMDIYAPGPQGPAATVNVGTTTTTVPSTPANVINSGTEYEAVLDFYIPQGEAATVDAGATTTLVPGSAATVVNVGNTAEAVFDFGIPRGSLVTVGTTVTGAPGSAATVTDDDATTDVRLNFSIPQGIQGVQGEVAVDSTVTGAPGTQAIVEDLDASINKALLKFTIPRGDKGDQGEVAVDSTITGGVGTPALVEDLDPSPNRALLRFTIPQGPQGVPGPGGTPGGPAGGDLAGTYPNPTLAVDRVKKTGDTMSGNLLVSLSGAASVTASSSTTAGTLEAAGPAATLTGFVIRDNLTGPRWGWIKAGNESGSNVGSDLRIYRYSDAGASIDFPVSIKRSNGQMTVTQPLVGVEPTASTHLATKNYVDTKVGAGGMNRVISVISTNTSAAGTAKTDFMYICSAALTLTLPTAVGNTNLYTVKRTGTGDVTVNTTSSQTIDGTATFLIDVQYMAVNFVSDGANWVVC